MKRYISIFFILVLGIVFTRCGDGNDVEEGTPFAVTSFADQFFNGRGYSTSEIDTDLYRLKINSGPEMTLKVIENNVLANVYCAMLSYNGNGETMSQYLAQNQLPEKLYDYIVGLEMIGDIYNMNTVNNIITVELLDTIVKYNSSTGNITEE